MVKVLDELTPDQLLQAEKDKSEGKASRRKALPATYGPIPPTPKTRHQTWTDVGRTRQTDAGVV